MAYTRPRYQKGEQGQYVRVLGHVLGEYLPSAACLQSGAGMAPNTTTRFGPFPPDAVVEFGVFDQANLVSGTAEDVWFNPGDSTVTAAVATAMPRKTSLWPFFRVHLLEGQTYVALISAAAGAKTHNVYVRVVR